MRSENLETLRLTGRTGWRLGLFGRLILTVEVRTLLGAYPTIQPPPGSPGQPRTCWRDATVFDLLTLQSHTHLAERKLNPPPVNP